MEKGSSPGGPAWSEGHPLSEAVNQLIASMVRKVGGFTFQELNLSIDDIMQTSARGPDLSYDFVSRPAYVHALATGDTEFLRLCLTLALRHDLQPVRLVHALQNHDEMTYELVHFAGPHKDDLFRFRGAEVRGDALAVTVRRELVERLTGESGPYNRIFTTNGIACTIATVVAATLGYRDITALTDEQVDRITRAHLLLAMFNALQPGVFAVSGWDLSGMLTHPPSAIPGPLSSGDTRWIHRGAYDLMDYRPQETESPSRIPRGVSLYGSVPEQLTDPVSFVSQLAHVLAVRARHHIATGVQLDVPPTDDPALLAMVHRLDTGHVQVTVLNFADRPATARVASAHLPATAVVTNMFTDQVLTETDEDHAFTLTLRAHQGTSLLVTPPSP